MQFAAVLPKRRRRCTGSSRPWVKDHQVTVDGARVTHYQVIMKVTFVLD